MPTFPAYSYPLSSYIQYILTFQPTFHTFSLQIKLAISIL